MVRLPPCWYRKVLCVRGDITLCGPEHSGRVLRAMRDELGRGSRKQVLSPVEILGLSGVPSAGDETTVVRDERKP